MRFCEKCGNELNSGATMCVKCGVPTNNNSRATNGWYTEFCKSCGSEINPNATMCVKCGVPTRRQSNTSSRPKQKVFIHVILALCSYGIGNIIYYIFVTKQQKIWDEKTNNY